MPMNTNPTDSQQQMMLPDNLSSDAKAAVSLFLTYLAEAGLPGISRVLLYGSRARGDNHAGSDIDMAVILDGYSPDKDTRFALRMQLSDVRSLALWQTNMPISAVLLWESDLLEPPDNHNPDFYHNLQADGIEIKTSIDA